MSRTLIIIKPDAIKRKLVGRIISRFEDADFNIVRIGIKQKDLEWFDKMYSHLTGDVRIDMLLFMLETPIIGIVFEGPFAVERVRKMVGKTNSIHAASGTVRGDFGSHPIRYNCVHASDSVEAVEKEITLFFGEES